MARKLTAERLRELLAYDTETGVFRWRARPSRWSRIRAGNVAGCVKNAGYREVGLDSCRYRAHRLAWLYVTGEWPASGLDHENLNKDDNRWANLRPATVSQNGANRRLCSINTSGFKGVNWDKQTRKWRSTIMVNGKTLYLGRFDLAEDAHAAYAEAADKYFGEFARAA